MGTVVTTVFTPRRVAPNRCCAALRKLYGNLTFVWVANGGDSAFHRMLAELAGTSARPTILLSHFGSPLPISWAYNIALAEAKRIDPLGDVLELQDDVLAPAQIVGELCNSSFDLPGAWHANRELRQYSILEARYVVGMCVYIRNRVFEKLGFHWEGTAVGVDADYGCRAWNSGFSVGFIDQPRVMHIGSTTAAGDNKRQTYLHWCAREMLEYLQSNGLLAGWRWNLLSKQQHTQRQVFNVRSAEIAA